MDKNYKTFSILFPMFDKLTLSLSCLDYKLVYLGMLQDDEVEDVEVGIPGQAVLT